MPYCRKCGAKIAEEASFCQVCGTQVMPTSRQVTQDVETPHRMRHSNRPGGFWLIPIVLTIVIIMILAALLVVFLPYHPVTFNQSNQVSAGNVDTLRLVLNSEIANVNVMFKELPGNQLATTNISATGWRSMFGNAQPLALGFDENTQGNVLTWRINVSRAGGWQGFNSLEETCEVHIDPSLDLDIEITAETGTIMMYADKETTFKRVDLKANAGSINANIQKGAVIAGNFSIETTAGSTRLLWDEAEVFGNIPINLKATAGSTEINITQTRQLGGNITLSAEATLGSVNLAINIQNDVGARIAASAVLGGINIEQNGFSGDEPPLQSDNYSAGTNFDVILRATTGGINIDAKYQLGGTRS